MPRKVIGHSRMGGRDSEASEQDDRTRRGRRRFLLILVLCIGVPGIIYCTYLVLLMNSFRQFSDAYASDWTSAFVIEHLRTTGEWPSDWNDLRDEFDEFGRNHSYAWSFEELQERVWLDWDAELDAVRDADPALVVFRLRSGRTVSFNGDPNQLIQDFLRTGEDPHRIYTF